MSAFYDQASLVVVPSGYKSGKIYAQKPLTTDGQLTFTRASTATRVNASGLIESVASGVPRLDYLGSTCPKLLLEPQRSNLVTRSETFENAAWTKYLGATVTANTVISPDGTQNADTLNALASSTQEIYNGGSKAASAITYTFSCFAKYNGSLFTMVASDFATSGTTATFNLQTGTVVSISTGITWSNGSAKIENYGNGWYRCIFTATSPVTTGLYISLTGTTYIWGCQIEQGAYVTSYVKTEAATVTRLADAASKTGISSIFGATATTYFMDVIIDKLNPSGGQWTLTAALNGSNFLSLSQFDAATRTPRFAYFIGGAPVWDYIGSTLTAGRHKIAAMVKNGSQKFYIDGVLVASNTGSGYTQFSQFALNDAIWASPLQNGQFAYNQVLVFPTELTNAQLAELTTL
jgi:hypothetical protein